MRAKRIADARSLGLGSPIDAATPDEDLANAAGDPAYLHELGEVMAPWSRKRLENAVNRLLADGRLIAYGRSTRRLYSSPRIVDELLLAMPAAHVRLLQYMPLAGGVEHAAVTNLMSETSPMVDALCDAGLLVRVLGCGARQILMLTAHGRRVRETLGVGLALPPLQLDAVRGEVGWWTTLAGLVRHGEMARRGVMDEAVHLIDNGHAIVDGDMLVVTETGRAAYHARIDLIDITRLVERGAAPADAHERLAEHHQHKDIRSMGDTAAPTPTRDRRLHAYLLMRTDMPSLGIGKARAQAMHAGNNMTHELYVKPLKAGLKPEDDVERWHDQGAGFGTAIAIGARNEITLEVLTATIEEARRRNFLAGLIVDEEYPYNVSDEMHRRLAPDIHTRPPVRYRKGWRCHCRETTAGWIFGDKAELEDLLSRFNLTPHAEREKDAF